MAPSARSPDPSSRAGGGAARQASGDAFRRFERRMRRRLDAKVYGQRAVRSIPTAIQIVVGVLLSYSIAHFLIGHATPLLAVTVVISTLGFARDARPRRVLESTIGILIGIVLSEVLVLLVGRGIWQIALVLFVTIVIARALSASPAFAVGSAVQSVIVVILPAAQGGPFARSEDAFVAGAVALLITALVPRDLHRVALRDARNLASVLSQSTASLVEASAQSSAPAASLAVERLGKTQEMVGNWSTSLDSAIAVARISPLLRRQLPELRRQAALLRSFDLAVRHLRIIARRLIFLLRAGGGREELTNLLGSIAHAIDLLGAGIDEPARSAEAATVLSELAPRLDPESFMPQASVTESVFVLLARPLVVDLLVGTGLSADDARAMLPTAGHPRG